jgi:hypothetical protein
MVPLWDWDSEKARHELPLTERLSSPEYAGRIDVEDGLAGSVRHDDPRAHPVHEPIS